MDPILTQELLELGERARFCREAAREFAARAPREMFHFKDAGVKLGNVIACDDKGACVN